MTDRVMLTPFVSFCLDTKDLKLFEGLDNPNMNTAQNSSNKESGENSPADIEREVCRLEVGFIYLFCFGV